jgi:hypothetical protein
MTGDEWLECQNENRRAEARESATDLCRTGNRETLGNRRKHSSGSNKNGKMMQFRLCKNYNETRCTFEGDHTQGSVICLHACLGCKLSGHRIMECRKNGENSKN